MDKLLTNFIRALRNAEVRISTAETLDAMRAVELVGYRDRALLKNTLGLVLPKSADEKVAFDVCFERFFAVGGRGNVGADRAIPGDSPDSAREESEAQSDGGERTEGERTGGKRRGGGGGGAHDDAESESESELASAETGESTGDAEPQSSLGQLLMRGDRMDIGMAIARAGEAVGVQNIEVFTQKSVYTRKIMNAMGLPELSEEVERLQHSPSVPGRRLANELGRRRDWLRDRVREYVEHQFLLHADVTGKRLQEDLLKTVRLSNVEQRNLQRMQKLIERMAKRLVSMYSRRRRVYRRGQLHVPRTLRHNMSYDGAIFDLRWRSQKLDRPKVFVLCDVSGSVADYAKFMLMLLYSLEEVLPKVRSFAFSSDLAEVSQYFDDYKIEDAIARILLNFGGSTDYGHALADFQSQCLSDVDRRSTIIILGDARNNYGDPRADILKTLYERCRRLIWLNPEPRSGWDLGDSEMRLYGVYCHQVEECGSLQQLERVVSGVLRATA